jgi:lipopolysaccharide/colanic/teichoic acid biosynthesis glycosyltransferase
VEINNLFVKHRFSDNILFTCSVIAWLCVYCLLDSIFNYAGNFAHFVILSGAALAAVSIFKMLENIPAFKIIQKPSESFLLTMAFIVGSVALNVLLATTNKLDIESFRERLLTGLLCILVLLGYGFTFLFLVRYEKKRKVALYLDSKEIALLENILKTAVLQKSVNFISKKDFKECILRNDLNDIDLIIISRETVKNFDIEAVLIRAHLAGVPIIDLKDMSCKCAGRIDISETDLSTYLLSATQKTLFRRLVLRARSLLEPVAAFFMILLLFPLAVLVALIIKITSPGPIIYSQKRTGLSGRTFQLLKFRSMYFGAESEGPRWCSDEDTRITPFGAFMRRTRLDELPQLWNILWGEMSFIGPRPERPEMYQLLDKDVPLFSLRTLVRPGITGWAQINSGYAASIAESHLKLEYDLFYIQHMSLRFDLFIILKTVKVAFFGDDRANKTLLKLPAEKNYESIGKGVL